MAVTQKITTTATSVSGSRLRSSEPIRIAGVVGDTTPAGPDGTVTPEIYFSYLQFPIPNPRFSGVAEVVGERHRDPVPGHLGVTRRLTVIIAPP